MPTTLAIAVLIAGSALYILKGPWWLPWILGLAVIAACPFVDLARGHGALDGMAAAAVALLAVAGSRLAVARNQAARSARSRIR